MNKKGFTLLELLIAIIILGILTAMISGNFFTSLKKGRDARRKADLEQIGRAVEMFYEDKRGYPTPTAGFPFNNKFCETGTCASSEKIYMQKVANDPMSNNSYAYLSDGTYYRLFACIENSQDQGPGVSQKGYTGAPSCGGCTTCKYTISSPNITPLPTLP